MSCDVLAWCDLEHDAMLEDWDGEDGNLHRPHERGGRPVASGVGAYLFADEGIGAEGVTLGAPSIVIDAEVVALDVRQARELAVELMRLADIADGTAAPTAALPGGSDDDLLRMMELEMRARACRPRSIQEMRTTLRSLARRTGKPLLAISRNDLMAFLTREGLAPVSIRTYRTAITSFYKFLVAEGVLPSSPAERLPRVRMPHTEPDPLTSAEVQRLLDCGIRKRTRMMVLLAAYQGLRAVEVSQVHGSAINWERMEITVRGGKGGTNLIRPLHSAVAAYAVEAGFPTDGWWFPGMPGRDHVSAQQVSTTLARALERAGITGHRPHQLRAWHATELIAAGTDAVTVQYSMRHANLSSLHKYARPSNERIRDAIEALPHLRA